MAFRLGIPCGNSLLRVPSLRKKKDELQAVLQLVVGILRGRLPPTEGVNH